MRADHYIEIAYKSLRDHFSDEGDVKTLKVMTSIEAIIVYAEKHLDRNNIAANVQQKLLDYLTHVLDKSNGFLKVDRKILKELKSNFEHTPLTDSDVNQWKIEQFFKLSNLKYPQYVWSRISESLRSEPKNVPSDNLYAKEAPEMCMYEAMEDYKMKLSIIHEIFSSRSFKKSDSETYGIIEKYIYPKFKSAIDDVLKRMEEERCYEHNFNFMAIVLRMKYFLDGLTNESERSEALFQYFQLNKDDIKNERFLLSTFRNVSTEVRRSTTNQCSFNRLLIILQELARMHMNHVDKKRTFPHPSVAKGDEIRLRQLWANEREFISTYHCYDRRYVHYVNIGEWMLDISKTNLRMEIIDLGTRESLIKTWSLMQNYYQTLVSMVTHGESADNDYINSCTRPIAKDLLAYLEHPSKREAVKLCLARERNYQYDFFDFMADHYRKFFTWIIYRTVQCRRGLFHLVLHRMMMNLFVDSEQLSEVYVKLETAIQKSGRRHKPGN